MQNEAVIRLSIFLGLFALFALLEWLFPSQTRVQPRSGRWATNLLMTALNAIALRAANLALPFLAIGAAIDAWSHGWGLLNNVAWPLWVEVVMALLVLDFAIWAQHLVTHKVPVLWRFHRMHHSDRDMDVSTALRFHPAEILVSMGLKIALVYALGPQALAVLVFEILLNGTAMFNHANLALPRWLDTLLRLVIVKPGMHRIHHSTRREEHDSNYGFALSIWDRIFGTYRKAELSGLVVGLEWQDDKPAKLGWCLWLPLR